MNPYESPVDCERPVYCRRLTKRIAACFGVAAIVLCVEWYAIYELQYRRIAGNDAYTATEQVWRFFTGWNQPDEAAE